MILSFNAPRGRLLEYINKYGELKKSQNGLLVANSGINTGRSPNAKKFVKGDAYNDHIDWNKNQGIEFRDYLKIKTSFLNYLSRQYTHIQDVYACHDRNHKTSIRCRTETAWHAYFVKNVFIEDPHKKQGNFSDFKPSWGVYHCPSYSDDPMVIISMEEKLIFISGTDYAGEIKKSIFTALNLTLPQENVLPMHCSVNVDKDGLNPAVFFGLSGTGKTTLSSDTGRLLVGDDEHGWSSTGIFNFEGGCYAKTFNITQQAEPAIWDAIHQPYSLLENVVIENGKVNFSNDKYTKNGRASYPLTSIKDRFKPALCTHPKNVIMLTCDAFGVLPPVSKLTYKEALDMFLLGYTAKVAGTEKGVTEPIATFSHCFGAPFMPRRPVEYAHLLKARLKESHADCWLVNTGWTGGGYKTGKRMPLEYTRDIIRSIIDGTLSNLKTEQHEYTKLHIPKIENKQLQAYLIPEFTWQDKKEYKKECKQLMDQWKKELKLINP